MKTTKSLNYFCLLSAQTTFSDYTDNKKQKIFYFINRNIFFINQKDFKKRKKEKKRCL